MIGKNGILDIDLTYPGPAELRAIRVIGYELSMEGWDLRPDFIDGLRAGEDLVIEFDWRCKSVGAGTYRATWLWNSLRRPRYYSPCEDGYEYECEFLAPDSVEYLD